MRTNTDARAFDVVEITNEMPLNRIGGVGTVIEHLMTGFARIDVNALWFVVDHPYSPSEVDALLRRYPSTAVGTADDLARFDAPVAHLHTYSISAPLLDALSDWVVVFTVHSLLAEEERSNDVDLAAAVEWQETLLAACDHVALVSHAELGHYKRLGYERRNPRASVVHNGVRVPARRRYVRGRDTLGYSGRLVPRKHPEYVQMVLREPEFAHCRTLIAGKAFSHYARNLVDHLGLDGRVRYLGWCGGARLEAFYDAIDVLALPSVYEPFGFAALEAAARGVPVVCTAADGLLEVLADHAFYAAGPDYEHFRDAIRRWRAVDADEVSHLAEAAHARAREHFTDVAMARRYEHLFARVS
jgi:glycosyltransferase involved in cell wall biosynthesis